ncbi:rhomboid family intramembrane serine protease GlpG [Oceanisphaera pacifica]|uniref:Rhomboid family intramembrane serine protease GlpG n=1 Tax=Oceanisphaera pacifica TaxID=2818389 RepID=A0ABS3NH09_9GAMM|nr:rhomboid family intramembrane serine protease GlpG [Oceanisphaera pacifica]MBO1519874.1 rhomboid family intramembrane serine protease GlpG [Oceanisphaera pacifica]
MKRLLVLDDPRRAQSLVDYLTDLGLKCELTLDDQHNVTVWLVDEAQWPKAEPEIKRFIAEPLHPRYQAAAWRQGNTDVQFTKGASPSGLLSNFLARTGPVNMLILVACLLIYGLSQVDLPVVQWLSFVPQLSLLLGADIWRGFTPALLHFSLMHLVFNLFWWWYLASMVERQRGHGKLLLLLLVASLLPNIMQFLVSGPYFGGLSGVVYALLAYVWLSGRLNPAGGISLPDGMAVIMVVWLVLGFAGVLGPVANLAHLGGGVIGLIQAWLDRTKAVR